MFPAVWNFHSYSRNFLMDFIDRFLIQTAFRLTSDTNFVDPETFVFSSVDLISIFVGLSLDHYLGKYNSRNSFKEFLALTHNQWPTFHSGSFYLKFNFELKDLLAWAQWPIFNSINFWHEFSDRIFWPRLVQILILEALFEIVI